MIGALLATTLILVQGQVSPLTTADRGVISGLGLGFEATMGSRMSLLFNTRKETPNLQDGYLAGLSLAYRGAIARGVNGRFHLGVEAGYLSGQYDHFEYRTGADGHLRYQRWEFASENAGTLTVQNLLVSKLKYEGRIPLSISPVVGVSASIPLVGKLSIRDDFSVRLMRYGVKESWSVGSGPLVSVRDDLFWKPVPSLAVSLGYTF